MAHCWSCGCMFQSGLQHHAESRDHLMYHLSRSLWGWHSKMKIYHQNGWSLPHQAEIQKITMLLKKKQPFLYNSFVLSWGANLKVLLITGSNLNTFIIMAWFFSCKLLASLLKAFRLRGRRRKMWTGKKIPSSLLPSPSLPPSWFFPAFSLRAALHYLNSWNRLTTRCHYLHWGHMTQQWNCLPPKVC